MGTISQEKGYLVGNIGDLDARFKCTHCSLLLREPMQGDCGHRYCKNCVQIKYAAAIAQGLQSLCGACDSGEQSEISPDRVYQDNAIRREITKSLQVTCPNAPCDMTGLLSDLQQHLYSCQFKPQPCDLCGQPVAAVNLADHRANLCPRRPEKCDVCKETVPYETLAEHKANTCVGSTVQCEYCLARVKDDADVLEAHSRSECPAGWHEKNPCPYGCTDVPDGDWRKHREESLAVHVDRLLAKSRQRGDPEVSDKPQSKPVMTDSAKDTYALVLAGGPESEMSQVNYEELTSLRERASAIERRLMEMLPALSSAQLLGDAGGDTNKAARKHLADLQTAVSQGDKLNELLGIIKDQFDACYEKIRQYELRMQKDLEKKLDIERKHQELVKLLAYKEMKILDLERRVEILEHAGYDGVLIWKITDVRRRKEEAREGKVCSIYSPPFYTGKAGYKMCGRLYLNGDGAGKNTHISLFFVIMRGNFDALLPWPFSKKVSMMLLDQNFEEHVIDAFKPDTSSSSFKRPTTDMNIASGCPLFMPLNDFENSTRGYVKDDTMFIKFIVDKSDLPT